MTPSRVRNSLTISFLMAIPLWRIVGVYPSDVPEKTTRTHQRDGLASAAGAGYDSVLLLVDWRLELVEVPVSDVDRAKAFYTEKIGFNADHDHTVNEQIRFVQLTTPGS